MAQKERCEGPMHTNRWACLVLHGSQWVYMTLIVSK